MFHIFVISIGFDLLIKSPWKVGPTPIELANAFLYECVAKQVKAYKSIHIDDLIIGHMTKLEETINGDLILGKKLAKLVIMWPVLRNDHSFFQPFCHVSDADLGDKISKLMHLSQPLPPFQVRLLIGWQNNVFYLF